MIDLHCHSFFSDGVLCPAELLRRVEVMEYEAIAITDHVDSSNLEFIISNQVNAALEMNPFSGTTLIPGVELTHVPPALFGNLTSRARKLGAKLVVAHGETVVEPVAAGTNLAAIEAEVDILAHPGFITEEEAALAAAKGVYLELTVRGGHSLTNGHVAKMALKTGAKLVVNSDGHAPRDFLSKEMAEKVALGAGLSHEQYEEIRKNMVLLVEGLKSIVEP